MAFPGLRVCELRPSTPHPRANTNMPTLMIAECIADRIKPRPAARPDLYRHDRLPGPEWPARPNAGAKKRMDTLNSREIGIIMPWCHPGRYGMKPAPDPLGSCDRWQGAWALSDGSIPLFHPYPRGPQAEKVAGASKAHGVERMDRQTWTALSQTPDARWLLDAASMKSRPALLKRAIRRRQARLLREADLGGARRGRRTHRPLRGEERGEERYRPRQSSDLPGLLKAEKRCASGLFRTHPPGEGRVRATGSRGRLDAASDRRNYTPARRRHHFPTCLSLAYVLENVVAAGEIRGAARSHPYPGPRLDEAGRIRGRRR